MMISKSYSPTVASRYKAIRQIFHKTMLSRIFYAIFVGLPVLLVITNVIDRNASSPPIFNVQLDWSTILILLSYPFVLLPVLQYVKARRTYKNLPSARGQHTYEFNEQGMINTGPGYSLDLTWPNILKIDLSRDFLMLFLSRSRAYCLPRDLLSDDEVRQIKQWHAASCTTADGANRQG